MGPESAARLLPLLSAGACSQRAGCVRVSRLFVFLLHVLLLLALSSVLALLCTPSSPAPGTHLPARSWRSRSAGPDLFPTHPPKVSACPALPSVSLLYQQLAWQAGELEKGRQACLQQASGPFYPPSSPRH